MTIQTLSKVYSASTYLEAITLQDTLQMAGLWVDILSSKNGGYLDLVVPSEQIFEAENLINPLHRTGEIFAPQG